MEHNENIKQITEVNSNEEIEKEVSSVVSSIVEQNGKKLGNINKRIDFDINTYKKLEMMSAVFKYEIEGNVVQNEVMSYVIQKAIDKFFEEEFKMMIEEL